jgi:hypothetical protein
MAFAYQYNPRYLFTYLALASFLLVFSYSELWRHYVDPILDRFFFREDLKNPLVIYDHEVRTSGQISQDKTNQELKAEVKVIK